jgi:hypothetical protein
MDQVYSAQKGEKNPLAAGFYLPVLIEPGKVMRIRQDTSRK